MGYRSEVKYVIYDPSESGKLKDYISYLILQNDIGINEALESIQVSSDYKYIYFSSEWVKWYSDYIDVIAHTKIFTFDFNYFDNEDSKSIFNSLFIRVGEDDTDSEIESYNSINKYENPNAFDIELSNSGESHIRDILEFCRYVRDNFEDNIQFNNISELKNEN